MNRPFSVYLDLVRFVAACLVYLYHSNMRALVSEPLPASQLGHESVIVFFVLSGLVIAYVADTKEKHWIDFSASRLARIYSVVVPALVLTLVLDHFGRGLYPELYGYPYDQVAVRTVASTLMLNEVWFISITTFSNVPYWSITYESWYYVAFALVMFVPGKLGCIAASLVLLLIGPKLILLLPVWACGVLLYRWQALHRISAGMGLALVVITVLAIPGLFLLGVFADITAWTQERLGPRWFEQLTFSRFALGDYLLGALVFLHLAGMRRVAPMMAGMFRAVERPVRLVASYTFTLYLLHQPLFLFWGSVLRGDPDGIGNWVSITVLTAVSVLAVGHVTERRRHHLKRLFRQALGRASAWARLRRAASGP